MYKILNDIEHILARPDMYLGENILIDGKMLTYNENKYNENEPYNGLVYKQITYKTGFIKIFDEILMNAIDNINRGKTKNIDVKITKDYFEIVNDGNSIPIQHYSNDDKRYIPEVIFTQPRSGSNFDDTKQRDISGRNGIGCKLTSILSKLFIVEIVNNKQLYKQTYYDNLSKIEKPNITETNKNDYVSIRVYPDFNYIHENCKEFDDDTQSIMKRRVVEMTFMYNNVTISLNDKKIIANTSNWNTFCETCMKLLFNVSRNYIYIFRERTVRYSFTFVNKLPKRCQQLSWANGENTSDGGSHVEFLKRHIINVVKNTYNISTQQVSSKLFIMIDINIDKPIYTSQSKVKLSSKVKYPLPTEQTIRDYVNKCGLMDMLNKNILKKNKTKIVKGRITTISKLVDANLAGRSRGCTLFVCEGLSAKTMVDKGLCILGRDYFGCYPLRGKILNVNGMENTNNKYINNKVLTELKQVIGLSDGVKYTNTDSLRYDHVVCVKDADTDGANIMGLLINFFNERFPTLLRIDGFFSEFISAMIQTKDTNGNKIDFFNKIEHKLFIDSHKSKKYTSKYIKGLATNEDDDIDRYFNNFDNHVININFDENSDKWLTLAFDKKYADNRKIWIEKFDSNNFLPRVPQKPILINDFINIELAEFGLEACIRSIPSIIDGLKPTQRKIIYSLFNIGDKAYIPMKVFQLSGLVAKNANYHHGDESMNKTIIHMAQDYVGSNNIPLLMKSGQFGSRQENGKDSGAPRYISCSLNKITRFIFPREDDELMKLKFEDGIFVEPIYYCPIVPLILVNGCTGIGTGYSTSIPQFNILDIIENINLKLDNRHFKYMSPYYKGFNGEITQKNDDTWEIKGCYELKGSELTITEIPLSISISKFYSYLNSIPNIVKNYTILNTETIDNINVTITLKDDICVNLETYSRQELDDWVIKTFKLTSTIKTTNMVLFDDNEKIKTYKNINDIINAWYHVRYKFYELRIKRAIEITEEKFRILDNKARFIKDIIENKIIINNISINAVYEKLESLKYYKVKNSYNYLTDMRINKFTMEKYKLLLEHRQQVLNRLEELKNTTVEKEWKKDLNTLIGKLFEYNLI